MLKIRLQRVGRKHEPAFRLVLTDSKNSTKSGRFKEILGSYDPRKSVDSLKADRIKHWLSVGAHPSDTIHNLLVTHKIIDAKKKNVLPKKTPPVKEAVADDSSAPESAPAPETAEAETSVEASKEESAPAEPAPEAPVAEAPVETPEETEPAPEAIAEEKKEEIAE